MSPPNTLKRDVISTSPSRHTYPGSSYGSPCTMDSRMTSLPEDVRWRMLSVFSATSEIFGGSTSTSGSYASTTTSSSCGAATASHEPYALQTGGSYFKQSVSVWPVTFESSSHASRTCTRRTTGSASLPALSVHTYFSSNGSPFVGFAVSTRPMPSGGCTNKRPSLSSLQIAPRSEYVASWST